MTTCQTTPLELILATTDVKLYDPDGSKWLWPGTLYWAINCVAQTQRTSNVSIAPLLKISQYSALISTPSTWNFCNSNCTKSSTNFQVIFTFNPTSNDPKDYLQYIVNNQGMITDWPKNGLTDSAGKIWGIHLTNANVQGGYMELWIASGEPGATPILPNPLAPILSTQSSILPILLPLIILLVTIGGALIWYYFVYNRSCPTQIINPIIRPVI